MPSRIVTPIDGWSQDKQRGLALFYDQHRSTKFPDGRPWWCYTERPANGAAIPMPVGDLQPHGWNAPWFPEAKYMVMSMGTLASNKFRIAYERMVTDYRQAWDEYYQRAATEAAVLNLPIPDYGDVLTWKLRAVVGQPPRSPKIPEAALAGDIWLLGFTEEPNEYLARLLTNGTERFATARESEARQERERVEAIARMEQLAMQEQEAVPRKNTGQFKAKTQATPEAA
jgi:hypothetical protein